VPPIFASLQWDVTSRHWVTASHRYEEHSAFIFKGLKAVSVKKSGTNYALTRRRMAQVRSPEV
jgi:hypothetical protein